MHCSYAPTTRARMRCLSVPLRTSWRMVSTASRASTRRAKLPAAPFPKLVSPPWHSERIPAAVMSIRSVSSEAGSDNGHATSNRTRLVLIIALSAAVVLNSLVYRRWAWVQMNLTEEKGAGVEIDPSPGNLPVISLIPISLRQKADAHLEFYETLHEQPLDVTKLPIEEAILTSAPGVPPRIERDYPVLLQVPLTTTTKTTQITSQYKYEQWTFNNSVPAPFVRARVGDVVELRLTNKDETGNPHNIDSHAFTGPGGGAAVTTAEENETKVGRFKLLCPGLYIYHCAAAPVPVHIANGMYGLMYVQPAEGDLSPVDHEYYVMQSEYYHEPPEVLDDGRPSSVVEFSYPNGLREEPNIIVFNGTDSALTRDRPLKAAVGETVRIFFGNAGPNLTSSFHIIGSHFRNVYRDGDVISPPGRFIQTVSVPPGGSTIVDLKMFVPGSYTIVDHAIFRLDKGAVGFLNVSGKAAADVYESTAPPAPCVGCKLHP